MTWRQLKTGKVLLWGVKSTDSSHELAIATNLTVSCVAVSSTGNKVVCGSYSGIVFLWDLKTRKGLWPADNRQGGHEVRLVPWACVVCVAFSRAVSCVRMGRQRSIYLCIKCEDWKKIELRLNDLFDFFLPFLLF